MPRSIEPGGSAGNGTTARCCNNLNCKDIFLYYFLSFPLSMFLFPCSIEGRPWSLHYVFELCSDTLPHILLAQSSLLQNRKIMSL
jgi:hypothetical protein